MLALLNQYRNMFPYLSVMFGSLKVYLGVCDTLGGAYLTGNYLYARNSRDLPYTVNSRYIEVQGTCIFLRYNRVFVIKG